MIPVEVRIDGVLVNAQLYGPEEPQPKPQIVDPLVAQVLQNASRRRQEMLIEMMRIMRSR